MSIEDLGNIGDLIGGIGVIVTVLYLALQVRQQTRSIDASITASKAQTRTLQAQEAIEFIRSVRMDPDLMEIFLAQEEGRALSPMQVFRLDLFSREHFRGAEHSFYLYRMGTIDESEFAGIESFYREQMIRPEMRDFWSKNKHHFSTDFREEVERIYASTPDA
jgi:hypothetical protein